MSEQEELRARALYEHEKYQGKLSVNSKMPLNTLEEMRLFYTPGVAEPCKEIARDPETAYKYTIKSNTIAVVTDGTAVLGLGDIGALAGLPVMEGKAALFKQFGGVNAVPICLDTKDTEEIIETVKRISPAFGGINLEDISAPRCFEIEERLTAELDIPVFHDDQHGTAIVALAGLINSLKITGKKKEDVRVVISGAGAAGVAITKLLLADGFKKIVICDSKGIVHAGRQDLNQSKIELSDLTNTENLQGDIAIAMAGADIFIGVSQPDVITKEMVASMNADPIVFAMSNPVPEIHPDLARAGGAKIIATGRSDFPNQINNVLVFPGIFKGALKSRTAKFTTEIKLAAAYALAEMVENPTPEKIIPGVFDAGVADKVAEAVSSFSR